MHFLLKTHKILQFSSFNLQKNVKNFSFLFKTINSTSDVLSPPLSQILKKPTKNHTFVVPALSDAGYTQFREYSINLNRKTRKNNNLLLNDLINWNYRKFSNKMAAILAPKVKLNNGYEMPVLGLGTYELKKQKCENVIREALKIGYRHIDTAYLYRNESLIGKILNETFKENLIKREEIFLVTKLWCIFHEPKMVKYACKKQMEALQVDYIDLYLMHSPIGYKYVDDEALMPHVDNQLQTNDIDYVETYKAMEELVSLGWVRSLGLSNFNIIQMKRILDKCKVKPVTNQVECHPALNQQKLREFCKQHDIVVTAYSPLARPKICNPLPEFYEAEFLSQLAEKYEKTKAQIVLRYLLDIGTVPIPKSSQSSRLFENINVFDFTLTEEEIIAMNDLNTGKRLWRNEIAKFHQYWPFNEESKNNEGEIAVKHAIDVGYRHIDTAYFYQNEAEIGKAIKDKIAEGVVKREDIFLVTKLWNIHHEPERVEGACRKQLQLLGLDYIDLYLMHLPVGYKYVNEETLLPKDEAGTLQLSDVDYLDTYKAMEKLVKLGLVRSIGVSNFNSEQLQRVLDNCEIKPVTNQVECSPALNQRKLTQFCKERDVTLTAYSPLGRPKPAENKPEFYYSEKTKTLAEKYKKTPAQIILRYLIDIGTIPIPKSSNPQRIEENFNVFDFKLSAEDIAIMDTFHTGERLVPFNLIKGQNHKYWPFSIEF
ncbi:uncharacterized protein ACRADG_003245 [Cochliomyia hominivorax]